MQHSRILPALLALVFLVPAAAGAMIIEKGVKAGVNLTTFRGGITTIMDPENRTGFVGGVFVAFDFAPDLAIQVEGLYTQKGAKSTGHTVDDEGNATGTFDTFVNLTYLEVPVLLRGTLMRTAAVQPMYYLGPTIGFSLGGTVESKGIPLPAEDLTNLKAVDLGLALGAGVGFKLGGKQILTEVRYTTGFTDIYDLEDNLESINQGFALTAGIAF